MKLIIQEKNDFIELLAKELWKNLSKIQAQEDINLTLNLTTRKQKKITTKFVKIILNIYRYRYKYKT